MTDEEDVDGDDETGEEFLGDLLEEVERRRKEDDGRAFRPSNEASEKSNGSSVEETFVETPFEEVDDDLWEELEDGTGSVRPAEDDPRSESDAVSTLKDADWVASHVVSKRAFCETCPHLSDPPEFRCTHGGTEIVELVDKDNVRVRDCPIVEERRMDSEVE